MEYIALPTVTRTRQGVSSGAPYDIFAIESVKSSGILGDGCIIGEPPFYRVIGVKDGDLVLEQLKKGSQEFNRVLKWAGEATQSLHQRRILNDPNASCNVLKSYVIKLLSE